MEVEMKYRYITFPWKVMVRNAGGLVIEMVFE